MGTRPARIKPGSIPKYRQLLIILRNQIVGGHIGPGERIPSEEDLIGTYALSRGTVRKAIAQLEAEKLIETEHGIGSFVRALHPNAVPFRFKGRIHPTPAGRRSAAETSSQGQNYETIVQERVPAPLEIAERLRLSPGATVIHIARRRKIDGATVSYSERYLHEDILPNLAGEDLSTVESIHDLLVSRSDYPLLKAEFEIEAHLLNDDEASLLEAAPGEPAIIVHRVTYTAPARPSVLYYGIFRNRYELGVEIP